MPIRYFFILIVAVAGCHSKKTGVISPPVNRQSGGPLVVEGFVAQESTLFDEIEIPGTLLPEEETAIRSEVSGRVVQLNINEGALVKKGALLVKLFDADLQAQLKKLEVQLQIANKTEERQRELLTINGISQQDYDLSTLQVDNLKADIQSTRIAISKTEIRAPYDGKLGLRSISLGAYVSPAEIITTIRKVNHLNLEFSVPEKYAKEIKKGSNVRFVVDGGTGPHYASVLATENSVDQATRTLKVKAVVEENHPELVPGIFARVSMRLGKDSQAILVPTQSVIPQARTKQVMVLRNDTARFADVETGIRDSVFVQITSGISSGDTVITTGLMAIKPNTKVKIGKVNRYQRL